MIHSFRYVLCSCAVQLKRNPLTANLNASQLDAIAVALSHRMALIQGPPGTGKTTTIAALVAFVKTTFK